MTVVSGPAVFSGQIAKLFPAVHDTKVMAEYQLHEQPSYLQFLFNRARRARGVVGADGAAAAVGGAPVVAVCRHFAEHGHCAAGGRCPLSHDMQRVVSLLCPVVVAAAAVGFGRIVISEEDIPIILVNLV
jgi:hypothetical protein